MLFTKLNYERNFKISLLTITVFVGQKPSIHDSLNKINTFIKPWLALLDTAIDRQIARQPEHSFVISLYMEPNKL